MTINKPEFEFELDGALLQEIQKYGDLAKFTAEEIEAILQVFFKLIEDGGFPIKSGITIVGWLK